MSLVMALLMALPNCGGDNEITNPDTPNETPSKPDDDDGKNPSESVFIVTPETAMMNADGGSIEFTLLHDVDKSNVGVEIDASACDWIQLADTRSITTVVVFKVLENIFSESRTANITFVDGLNNKKQVVKITQEAAENTGGNPLEGRNCANNEILYITQYGYPIDLTANPGFNGYLISNTYANGIGKLTFNADVTIIPDEAFKNQKSIKYILLPSKLNSVSQSAFEGCSGLIGIVLPKSVASIKNSAFKDCNSIASLAMPDGLQSIGAYAFCSCSSLASLTLPDSLQSIGAYAFSGCSSLASLAMPDGLQSIGAYAFSGCSSLVSLTIPDSVTSLGSSAFSDCMNLTSLALGNGITSISSETLDQCASLTSLSIGSGVKWIGDTAFSDCVKLDNVTIPDNVSSLGSKIFYGSGLTKVVIGKGITDIETDTFEGYTKEITMNFNIPDAETDVWDNTIGFCQGARFDTLIIGDDVTKIGESAFYKCDINHISIGKNVRSIGQYAFKGYISKLTINCSVPASRVIYQKGTTEIREGIFEGYRIRDLVVGDDAFRIGDRAFYNCQNMISVKIGNGVRFIDQFAFYDCARLDEVIIGEKVAEIGELVFYAEDQYGDEVDRRNMAFYCKAMTSPRIWQNSFGSKYNIGGICVPRQAYDGYMKNWSSTDEDNAAEGNWYFYKSIITPYDFE